MSADRPAKELSCRIPHNLMYLGIQYASSGNAWFFDSHVPSMSDIVLSSRVLSASPPRLRCDVVSSFLQFGHRPSRERSQFATIVCVPQNPEHCFVSHCLYSWGLPWRVASCVLQSTALKETFVHPSPPRLSRTPRASRSPSGVV